MSLLLFSGSVGHSGDKLQHWNSWRVQPFSPDHGETSHIDFMSLVFFNKIVIDGDKRKSRPESLWFIIIFDIFFDYG